jgi:purine-binding chemotaxis protein CheW
VVIVEVDMEIEKAVMGIIVDAVSQVVDFSADDIEPPPAFGTRVHVDYLQGMGKLDEKFVLLIDTDRILAAEELMEVNALETEGSDRNSRNNDGLSAQSVDLAAAEHPPNQA